jgi:RNA polymerase sigma factor (sigma-70 family)
LNTTLLHNDQYIIDGLALHDAKVIRYVYEHYRPKMCAWLMKNSASEQEAEDVFQDSLLDIYRKTSQSPIQLTCPFDAFIFVIVRNKWFSSLKKNKVKVVTNTDDIGYTPIQDTHNAAEVIAFEQKSMLLKEKLNELHDACKELLELSWSGKNMEQVASILNVTYAYARKKKSGCMAKLVALVKNSSTYKQLIAQ